ncbi:MULTISPECIES: PIN domain nuclease [unclassified Aureimonas]|uniref:type II toxin-antitoxin system VapC family toxin n=1 Tax=unclassified Aureimonas TaxID=2615206 RepID=UPI0006FE1C23|nr:MULTISPECIES: PIN domain nuclease [unclassified Aureimonas]KQT52937.1 hypothetical protein ASG62_13575 [Aureimonas sp. Leaf427]KQT80396.1 hypothetical protein ASG54_07425 [Aureimonas sp. Leaf460]
MILIDTSAWIDYFNGVPTPPTRQVEKALLTGRVIVGDLVMTEVLQGVRDDRTLSRIADELARFRQVTLCGPDIAILAASNYRLLRRGGITIRGTIDVIIATWCMANDAEVIHNDRDLKQIERLLGLRSYQ